MILKLVFCSQYQYIRENRYSKLFFFFLLCSLAVSYLAGFTQLVLYGIGETNHECLTLITMIRIYSYGTHPLEYNIKLGCQSSSSISAISWARHTLVISCSSRKTLFTVEFVCFAKITCLNTDKIFKISCSRYIYLSLFFCSCSAC